MPVTIEAIRSLSDDDLDKLIDSGVEEKRVRTERRKQETIAKIKELAATVGVPVSFGGTRVRPKAVRKPKPRAK
jgi:hypothetical protein